MSATIDLTVDREAGALGARVDGLDLAAGFDERTVAALKAALQEHLVIALPGQGALTPGQQLELAHLWGEVAVHPYVPSIESHPGIMRIYDPNELTRTWHQDTTHMAAPPAVSILVARVLPRVGGDTMWSNQYLAYERLSPGLRATLDGLKAVHQGTTGAHEVGKTLDDVTAVHPVVRTHPETGRKALFVNACYTKRFDGWTEQESAPLLSYLYDVASRPELTWRHRWHLGDLVIWDNRCTQHCVVGDTGVSRVVGDTGVSRVVGDTGVDEERTLHRVTIAGDVPH